MDALEDLAMAVFKTFAIVLLGYGYGNFNILPPIAVNILGLVVAKLALPVVLFLGTAGLDLGSIDIWILLLILIGKLIIFAITAGLAIIAGKGQKMGAIFAMFTTTSNDIAVGLPVVDAIYPQFTQYLLLAFPLQIGLVNTIAVIMLETAPNPEAEAADPHGVPPPRKGSSSLKLLAKILGNPIVFMVILGLFVNLIGGIPRLLKDTLGVVGNAFAFCALFQVGMGSVGQASRLKGRGIVWPLVLSLLKTVAHGILLRYVAVVAPLATKPTDLEEFFFIFGTIPTAPVVVVIARGYGVDPGLIAGASVVCLVLSAPVMFIVTVIFTSTDLESLNRVFRDSALWTLWVGLGASILTVVSGCLIDVRRHHPTKLISLLAGGQVLYALALMICIYGEGGSVIYGMGWFFRQLMRGLLVMLALNIRSIVTKSAGAASRAYEKCFLWAPLVYALANTCLVMFAGKDEDKEAVVYFFCWYRRGILQRIVDVFFAFGSLGILLSTIVTIERVSKHTELPMRLESLLGDSSSSPDAMSIRWSSARMQVESKTMAPTVALPDKFRVLVILFVEVVSLMFQLLFSISQLVGAQDGQPGTLSRTLKAQALVLVIFSDAQGLWTFLVYGTRDELGLRLMSHFDRARTLVRRRIYGVEEVPVINEAPVGREELAANVALIRDLLNTDLIKDRQHRFQKYPQSMVGTEVVGWMLDSGYALTRIAAVERGQSLVAAGLLHHVLFEHNFQDKGYLYSISTETLVRVEGVLHVPRVDEEEEVEMDEEGIHVVHVHPPSPSP